MIKAKCIAGLLLLIASSSAFSEGGSDRLHGKMIQANEQAMRAYAAANGKKPPEVIHYRYGMKLDVARIISRTSTYGSCDVMPAQMNYEDSTGELRILEYRTAGINCRGQN
ncbi:TPA: DUF2790 domain-containing protein [Pseudomonas putida]|uniref:DUF2790 domain-containing protein n=1 Tax=Pseudomonas putida S13.1.2 TaxID=1384061 RepID=A0AAU8S2B0_PSEPU|nr:MULTISPECIES: DUF2790 domain-containing protein [Pseudomonas]AJQ49824.1 hypothetical protein N805_22520 [Pseudomonas putida S13.1.2]ELU0814446.1 DUF2790 domain-containing protein [Pseudomonas putida]KAF1305598.1 hypothetical protein BLX42_25340 [Pseudomonas sp. SG-MS2]HDS1799149.1 DUF2790 domain-containing protein [Pseudomonas putida]HDS1804364.1 DUF2790 domain-containing protein [Pseudomonas putida]